MSVINQKKVEVVFGGDMPNSDEYFPLDTTVSTVEDTIRRGLSLAGGVLRKKTPEIELYNMIPNINETLHAANEYRFTGGRSTLGKYPLIYFALYS
jgi:hypothetical protein